MKENDLEKIIYYTSQKIATDIVKKHPRLKGREDYLRQYLLDKNAVKNAIINTIEKFYKEKKDKISISEIASKVIEQVWENPKHYLTERGKESILREYERIEFPLHDKLKPWYWGEKGKKRRKEKFIRETTKLDQYITNAIYEFEELKYLAKKYDGALTPEIGKLLNNLYSLGFAYESIDVLLHYKDINAREALKFRDAIRKSIKKGRGEIRNKIEEIISESLNIIIFLTIGIAILGFSAAHITGFVIGNTHISSLYTIAIGFLSLLVALFLSLKRMR